MAFVGVSNGVAIARKAQPSASRRERRSVVSARGGRRKEDDSGVKGRSRSAKRGNLYRRLGSYVEHFLWLSRMEFDAEQETVRELRREQRTDRLFEEGAVLLDMVAVDGGEFFSEKVVAFAMPGNENLPKQVRFSQGDIVDISRNNTEVSGVVLERTTRTIRIVAEDVDADIFGRGWRIDSASNSITHERICSALEAVNTNGRASSPDEVVNIICGSFSSDGVLSLRETLRSASSSVIARMDSDNYGLEEQAKQLPPAATKKVRERANAVLKEFGYLSKVQRKAVLEALCRRVTLIQGPPGTGKTKTACAIIKGLVALNSGPVLAVAASNTAADNILEGLGGMKVVRIGRAVSVRESLRWLTIEARIARSGPVASLTAKLRSAEKRRDGLSTRSIRAALREAEARATRKIVSSADVIVSTCASCGSSALDDVHIPAVVVDEATQATEPATLLPILRGCQQLTLVGDHHQLPPTVLSEEASLRGLDVSLFSRLWSLGIKPLLLTTQYRMHPALSQFPSDTFYAGKVTSAPEPTDRPAPANLPWTAADTGLLFIDMQGTEEPRATSFANHAEALAVAQLVKLALLDNNLGEQQIGVVTPYAGQVRVVREYLDHLDIDPLRVEVCSVDGFQGREKELIVVSTVRSNAARKIGFTSDWRRMNVALTRARRGLVVVGNDRTLSSDPMWKKWIAFMRKNQYVMRGAGLLSFFNTQLTKAGLPQFMPPELVKPRLDRAQVALESSRDTDVEFIELEETIDLTKI
mmetsp:Transcript_10665/g.32642  ORF Transcript_10665/g.32642 Transcript_10665/m.32642 type:complete len:757 (+) Transcript_10665:119-2389(+)